MKDRIEEKYAASGKSAEYYVSDNGSMQELTKKNSGPLKQEKGSLNHLQLNLGISSSARDFLNNIWDYHANLNINQHGMDRID